MKPSKIDINSTEKIKNEILESNTEGNAKRKYKDENEDLNEITLLDGLLEPKSESVPKKRKKIITADKMLKLEQEKV